MSIEKVRGIVIKEIPVGESNKQIVVLTKEHGKMLLSAKGARNPKSKFLAGTQLFSYCNFYLYEGKGFKSINQIDIIENFYNIRTDIIKLAFASYYSEIIEKTILEEMEESAVLELLLRTYSIICNTDKNIRLITSIFQLKYLQLSGFMPEIISCGVCGCKEEYFQYFNVVMGSVLCDNCNEKQSDIKISRGCYKAIKYVIESDLKDLYKFNLSKHVLEEFCYVVKSYMDIHINEEFKTYNFAMDIIMQ